MKVTDERGVEHDVEELPMPSLSGHRWKQFGNKIECQSCPSPHVAFLQPGFYISSYKNGIPVISQVALHPSVPLQEDGSVSVSDQPEITESRPTSSDA